MLFYIIGMPGAGKRRLGRELAEALGVEYEEVGSVEDTAIAGGIVAVTGLAPMDDAARERMKRGKVIYLYRSPEQLWEDSAVSHIPALEGRDYQFFCGLFEEYEDIFIKCADFLVYNDGFSKTAFRDARTFCRSAILLER